MHIFNILYLIIKTLIFSGFSFFQCLHELEYSDLTKDNETAKGMSRSGFLVDILLCKWNTNFKCYNKKKPPRNLFV